MGFHGHLRYNWKTHRSHVMAILNPCSAQKLSQSATWVCISFQNIPNIPNTKIGIVQNLGIFQTLLSYPKIFQIDSPRHADAKSSSMASISVFHILAMMAIPGTGVWCHCATFSSPKNLLKKRGEKAKFEASFLVLRCS